MSSDKPLMSDGLFTLVTVFCGVVVFIGFLCLAIVMFGGKEERPIEDGQFDRALALVQGDDSTALKSMTGLNYQGVRVTQRCRTVTKGETGEVGSWAITICWIKAA